MLAAIALFLTLIACGKRVQVQPTVPPVTPALKPDFAGLVNIGGRKMYLECRGTGSPIVILESGYRLQIPRMFAALLLISLSGIAIFFLTSWIAHLALRHWHESAVRREN